MSDRLKESLDRLHEKQDIQTEKLTSLEVSLSRQETALQIYAKHTNATSIELNKVNENMAVYNSELTTHIAGVMELKEQNKLIREEIKQRDIQLSDRLKVIEKPVQWTLLTGKFLAWFASIATILGFVIKYVSHALGL